MTSILLRNTEHSIRISAIPAEPGCNVCVRTYCWYFETKDDYVTLIMRQQSRLFQTLLAGDALCSRTDILHGF